MLIALVALGAMAMPVRMSIYNLNDVAGQLYPSYTIPHQAMICINKYNSTERKRYPSKREKHSLLLSYLIFSYLIRSYLIISLT